MRIYWYAPFNNTDELTLAELVARPGEHVVVHSLRTRFGEVLSPDANTCELVRDLPEPAGDDGSSRALHRRAMVALERAKRRARFLRATKFDLLHLHTLNTFTDGVAVPALGRRRVPIVLTVHNVRGHDHRMPTAVETFLLRPLYRAADAIIVAHTVLRDQLAAEFDVGRDRIHVVPHVVPEVKNGNNWPTATPDPRLCLFFGTFRANKGIPILLEGIEHLDTNTDARFHFAGRGDRELEELVVKAAKKDSRITAEIGYVSPTRMRALYSSSSLVVMPYQTYSAQSGVLREAYAFRKPVVVTDVGALGQAVREEGTGWVARSGDSEALAEALRDSLVNGEKRKSAVDAIHAIARLRSPDRIATAIRGVYDSVS